MLARLKSFAANHPRLAAWIALVIGMVIILVIAARDVGLLWNQWLFLILATIGLAGLCVWIIGWEANSDGEDEAGTASDSTVNPPAPKPPAGAKVESKESVQAQR